MARFRYIILFAAIGVTIMLRRGFRTWLRQRKFKPKRLIKWDDTNYGGKIVAEVLKEHGVKFVFTLTGGHIAPILVGSKAIGLRVVDVRHEVTAVFAADAVSRLTGIPGVAVVTAGPGLTNTITAVKNAQLAQSALVLLGGATTDVLKGRGSLQDIDQMSLLRPHVKWMAHVTRVAEIATVLEEAFCKALEGTPGPVFVEFPMDVLYPEKTCREWYDKSGKGQGGRGGVWNGVISWYLRRHVNKLFSGLDTSEEDLRGMVTSAPSLNGSNGGASAAAASAAAASAQTATAGTDCTPFRAVAIHHPLLPTWQKPTVKDVNRVATALFAASKPVILVGSQALIGGPAKARDLAAALDAIGAPVFLASMARGLLGVASACQIRHNRTQALREADAVLLVGATCDFRLDYGRHINGRALLVSVNRDLNDLYRNRRPTMGVHADPGDFVRAMSTKLRQGAGGGKWRDWVKTLRERDAAREAIILSQSQERTQFVNPLFLCKAVDRALGGADADEMATGASASVDSRDADSIIVADGGDFVGTASYIVRPRGPLGWLDPGVFGTLGVGAGFALGAKLCRPSADVWVLFGDGSVGYSLAEYDTFVRHGIPVIGVIGNDAAWMQMLRGQMEIFGDDVGCSLRHADYHRVAEAFGAAGFEIKDASEVEHVLAKAKETARAGTPVLVNAKIGRTDFRKDSLSM